MLYVDIRSITAQNAALVFEYLKHFITLLRSFNEGRLSEKTLSSKWALVHELLEGRTHFIGCVGLILVETLDYGYPQITQPEALKLYITQGNPDAGKVPFLHSIVILSVTTRGNPENYCCCHRELPLAPNKGLLQEE